jgi:anti-sigma factor RsiW
MTRQISFRDLKDLSASLDGQVSRAKGSRLGARLRHETELAAELESLRRVRDLLRQTPRRHARRRFLLTPRMAGIKPPVPRLVPAFSWASALALLFFIFTLGGSMLSRFTFGAAAPMAAAEPQGIGGGPTREESMVTAPDVEAGDSALTATPETLTMMVPEPTYAPAPGERTTAPPDDNQLKTPTASLNPWMLIWAGLALALVVAALVTRWLGVRAFRRRAR